MTIPQEVRNQIRRLFYVEHFTINAISESLGVHHQTVKRAINHKSFGSRRPTPSQSYWVEYEEAIKDALKKYPKLSSTRLIRILEDRGAKGGSLDSLRRFVRKIRPGVKEAFIKRAPIAGEEAQVDWGHFGTLDMGGAKRKLYCFVVTLSWSRYTFAKFTFDLKTETFLNCHSEAFRYFGGIPRILLYDNLKSVVIERQGDAIRFNPVTLDFAAHYNFEPRACNPYRGNEKGRVERKIRYIRENFFAARNLTDLKTLNHELREWLDGTANLAPWPDNKGLTVGEKFSEEKKRLLPLPEFHPVLEVTKTVRAGKYAHITFDLNTYSIPLGYVQRSLLVRASHDMVRIYAEAKLIAEHARCWGRGEEIFSSRHREDLIAKKKRGAFGAMRSELLNETPELVAVFQALADRGEPLAQAVNRLTELKRAYGVGEFTDAVREALGRSSFSPESIALILSSREKGGKSEPTISPCQPKSLEARELKVTSHSLETYDDL